MATRGDDLGPLGALVAPLAAAVADAILARLGGGDSEWIDQRSSPLGARRHCAAIRRGEIPGRQLGRRWIARRSDVDRYLASLGAEPAPRRGRAAELESELHR